MSLQRVALLKSRATQAGGLEKYASRIAQGFAKRGAEVSVLTTLSPSALPSDTPSISFHPCKTSAWPPFLRMEQFDRFVQKWLEEHKVDLVFGMDRNRTQTHLRAGNGVHAAYLKSRIFTEGRLKHWLCTLNPMHRTILKLEKEAFENPELKKLFANSHMVKEQILEHYAIDPTKIEVIHNGVEWEEMQGDFDAWEQMRPSLFHRLQLDPNRFHFLFIGNGYLRKGLDILLEALSRLSSRDVFLSVVGKESRQELYEAKAFQLGLKDKVRFFGPQSSIRPFYQLADALVIPSFYDPFANVTVEALAMGLFVLSSRYNGGSEVLAKESGAILENLLDPDSMAEALQIAMQRPKTRQNALVNRQSVSSLDFSKQLTKLLQACE